MTLSLSKFINTRIEWLHPAYKYLYGASLGISVGLTVNTLMPFSEPGLAFFGLTPLGLAAITFPILTLGLLYWERHQSQPVIPAEPVDTRDPVERFKQLAALKSEGLITDIEYAQKRDDMLRDL